MALIYSTLDFLYFFLQKYWYFWFCTVGSGSGGGATKI